MILQSTTTIRRPLPTGINGTAPNMIAAANLLDLAIFNAMGIDLSQATYDFTTNPLPTNTNAIIFVYDPTILDDSYIIDVQATRVYLKCKPVVSPAVPVYNSAIYAVANFCEIYFNTKMLWPSTARSGFVSNVLGVASLDLGVRTVNWVRGLRCRYDSEVDAQTLEWLTWNRVELSETFYPATPATEMNNSIYNGIALTYPAYQRIHYNPSAVVPIEELTKLNHKDHTDNILPVVHSKWEASGAKPTMFLFEMDGSNYSANTLPHLIPALNPTDNQRLDQFIFSGKEVTPQLSSDWILNNGRQSVQLRPIRAERDSPRADFTDFYIDIYKRTRDHFRLQGDGTRFAVLSYSNYYEFPADKTYDLSDFDTYYALRREDRLYNIKKWLRSSITFFLRPNYWYFIPLSFHSIEIDRGGIIDYMKGWPTFRGLYMDGYTTSGVHGTQSLSYYCHALSMTTNLNIRQRIQYFCDAFGPAAAYIKRYINFVEAVSTKSKDYFLLGDRSTGDFKIVPDIFTLEDCATMKKIITLPASILASLNTQQLNAYNFFRQTAEITEQTRILGLSPYRAQADIYITFWTNLLGTYPGLAPSISYIEDLVNPYVLPLITGFTNSSGTPITSSLVDQPIRIIGSAFTGTTRVEFRKAGTYVEDQAYVTTVFTVVTDTRIDVTVPSSAGTGYVVVTNPGGETTRQSNSCTPCAGCPNPACLTITPS